MCMRVCVQVVEEGDVCRWWREERECVQVWREERGCVQVVEGGEGMCAGGGEGV